MTGPTCQPVVVEMGSELKYVNSQVQISATVPCTLLPENHRDIEGIYFLRETHFSFLTLYH